MGGTVVVLMGVAERAAIAARLMAWRTSAGHAGGRRRAGGRPLQRVLRGRLDELAFLDVSPPATIVIGPVAALDLAGDAAASYSASPTG